MQQVITDLARAQALVDTRRYKDAESVLRRALAQAPLAAEAHSLLAFTLYHQDRNEEALLEARTAVGLTPDAAGPHYVEAVVLLDMGQLDPALRAIKEALRLDPERPAYYAVQGHIYERKKEWGAALRAAEAGLQLDPTHVGCINLRAMAQVGLGREDAAGATLKAALAQEPENALTHANQGWAMLHQGQYEQAFIHFREALRLDPTLEWARDGIVEAMRARNPLYRPILMYFLWMSRLTTGEQWGVIAALSGVRRVLRIVAQQVPALYVIAIPFSLLFALFAFLTWTGRPLFALVLRLDRFGRLALSREEIAASNWVGACLLATLLSGAAVVLAVIPTGLWGWPLLSLPFLAFSLASLLLMMPVAGVFRVKSGWRRGILTTYTLFLVITALVMLGFGLTTTPWGYGIAIIAGGVFLVLWSLYSLAANILLSV